MGIMAEEIGIYVHIPFCIRKCLYCDFISFDNRAEAMAAYKDALIKEINTAKELEDYTISSVFIGGGTPTALPGPYIGEILAAVGQYAICSDAEITIEANPKTLSREMLRHLKSAGINRLSIGLQAWQDHLLERLGRAHRRQDFLRNYEDTVSCGFSNINVDLMFGLPDQRMSDWVETLENLTALGPTHISAYSLIIEEHTPFAACYEKGALLLPGEDMERRMYWHARDYLAEKGYGQYEISNFAKSDFYSRHNVLYWERGSYRGFGLAAHSFMDGVRWGNTEDLDGYLQNSGREERIMASSEILSVADAMAEFMFLGLRLTNGINTLKFEKEFGKDINIVFEAAIQKNMADGLLVQKENTIALTPRGIDLANRVMADFLL